ncbi:organoarsenical effux MFS transporter ArsJ [Sediminihaliea albiluteola]|uniref:organoarsenical effux MFS transporter ArsJ n=1 Tax=Sediminihaliea albiluteola TaxID=2758564 RepID=UPI002E2C5C71|nr:organoarsenical effux MFS transporter ArsJ [Sediminihaliea albiluteola]
MNAGLAMQVVALSMLMVPDHYLGVAWVMAVQALSGIAKDLNKMSAKSAIRLLVPRDAAGTLYQWVAILTGSKNALKGLGFFWGGLLLAAWGFRGAIGAMALALLVVYLFSIMNLKKDLGKSSAKPKFSQIFSKSRAVNYLSAARLFLFAARDVWFVVALPVYLSASLGWDHWLVGAFLATWVIAYGIVQSVAPKISGVGASVVPDGRHAFAWASALTLIPAAIALAMNHQAWLPESLLVGLLVFGLLFAVNSALHSYLIVSYADEAGVSLDVGFYYMANAMGRLLGTVLSGWVFQAWGMAACLWLSSFFIGLSVAVALLLPRHTVVFDDGLEIKNDHSGQA